MLTFNPDTRYTVEECLKHPYFEDLYDEEDIIASDEVFDWDWDTFKLSKEKL